MHIPWTSPTCIICLNDGRLTVEHVIPASLGGKLTSCFLCKDCNDHFGHGFEFGARLAPELRRAAAGMSAEPGALAEAFEVGARYETTFGEQKAVQRVRSNGGFGIVKLPDDSLIVPEELAGKHISSLLRTGGASETEITAAIGRWTEAEAGTVLDLGWNVTVRKWANHPSMPAYTEPAMSPLVPLKAGYEFAAVILGSAILQPAPGLEYIRKALLNQDERFAREVVVARRAPKPGAFHGIAFMGNRPEAVIQVRLCGLLAFDVILSATGINFGRLVYTHRLDTGEEWLTMAD